MKQREIIFYSEGTKMVGTIYLPDDYKKGEKRHGIIANSGWTGVNKVYPAMFARQMTKYGYVCMGFDYRGFKPSGGISCSAQDMAQHIQEVGMEHCFLTSDRGQSDRELPAEGMLQFLLTLLQAGISYNALYVMTHTVPTQVLGII